MSLTTMKFLVIVILLLFPGIFFVGEWILSWTRVGEGDSLQVILCVFLLPLPFQLNHGAIVASWVSSPS